MTIPFKIKLSTKTAKATNQENAGDFGIYTYDFCFKNIHIKIRT